MSYFDPNQSPPRQAGRTIPRTGNGAARPSRPTQKPRRGFSGWALFWMFILGLLTAALAGAVALFFLFFNGSNPNGPLNRPPAQVGTPDFNATISQTYLNTELSNQLKAAPFKSGPLEVRDIVLKIQGNSQIEMDLRVGYQSFNFDISINEEISTQNGQINLRAVGKPAVQGSLLPSEINTVVELINNKYIEPQLNREISQIQVNGRPVKLLEITTIPGFIQVKANVGK